MELTEQKLYEAEICGGCMDAMIAEMCDPCHDGLLWLLDGGEGAYALCEGCTEIFFKYVEWEGEGEYVH